MNEHDLAYCCVPASGVRGYILEALDASSSYDLIAVHGLPNGSIVVPEGEVMIAETTAPSPRYRAAVERAAAERLLDVVLLRIGDLEDGLIRVDVDLTLAAMPGIWIENGLRVWTDYHARWLVPAGFGASVLLAPGGLHLGWSRRSKRWPSATLASRVPSTKWRGSSILFWSTEHDKAQANCRQW